MTFQLNFRRLGLLIHKQWVEHSRLYLYSVLALIGLLGIVFAVWIKIASPYFGGDRIFGVFLFGLFSSGAVFASVSFKMLEHKASGLFWWSLPASQLEKLLCVIFYNLIVFTVTYCLCFLLVEKLAVAYITSIVAKSPDRLYFNEQSLNWAQSGGIHDVLPYFMCAFLPFSHFIYWGPFTSSATTLF